MDDESEAIRKLEALARWAAPKDEKKMGKQIELDHIKQKWDALNLADLDQDCTQLADFLLAKCGGKTVPPHEARFFYDTLQDFLVLTLSKLESRTAGLDAYPFNWDLFTENMAAIFNHWGEEDHESA